jgi:N utilization substance protein B
MSEKSLLDPRNRRILAMQILYQAELLELTPSDFAESTIDMIFDQNKRDEKFEERVFELVNAVLDNKDEIDKIIEKRLKNWLLSRLANVDRNILRVAVAEVKYLEKDPVPAKVAINEAVEIAKIYCSSDSPGFINGVLDRVFGDLELLD